MENKKKTNEKSKKIENIEPNETLYINNLNDRFKSEELKINLFLLFSEYGDILNINISKSKLRGQAFIVYKNIDSAKNAKLYLNKVKFLGNKINVEYAKKKSNIIIDMKYNENSEIDNEDKIDNLSLLSKKRIREKKDNLKNEINKLNDYKIGKKKA